MYVYDVIVAHHNVVSRGFDACKATPSNKVFRECRETIITTVIGGACQARDVEPTGPEGSSLRLFIPIAWRGYRPPHESKIVSLCWVGPDGAGRKVGRSGGPSGGILLVARWSVAGMESPR